MAKGMQIVLARVNKGYRVKAQRRVDLGERPEMEETDEPAALMWCRDGTLEDFDKATAFAEAEGYRVFTYDQGERDPLGHAKKDAAHMAQAARSGKCKLVLEGRGETVIGRCAGHAYACFLGGVYGGQGTKRQRVKQEYEAHVAQEAGR